MTLNLIISTIITVVLVLFLSSNSSQESVRICGSTLTKQVNYICKGVDTDNNEIDSANYIPVESNRVNIYRNKRLIIEVCCKKPCDTAVVRERFCPNRNLGYDDNDEI